MANDYVPELTVFQRRVHERLAELERMCFDADVLPLAVVGFGGWSAERPLRVLATNCSTWQEAQTMVRELMHAQGVSEVQRGEGTD